MWFSSSHFLLLISIRAVRAQVGDIVGTVAEGAATAAGAVAQLPGPEDFATFAFELLDTTIDANTAEDLCPAEWALTIECLVETCPNYNTTCSFFMQGSGAGSMLEYAELSAPVNETIMAMMNETGT